MTSRTVGALFALAAALVAAFVVAPSTLAASTSGGGFVDERHLTEALRSASVEYWRSGDRAFPPGLARVVDYWLYYHVAKAMIAAILLVVLIVLGVVAWKRFLTAGRLRVGSRAFLASAGAFVTMLALFSLTIVMANVQGALAPFASLLPMLTDGAPDGELAETLAQVRQRLADSQDAPPALDVMISDFTRYHLALAVLAALVAVVLVGLGVASWLARTRSPDPRTRRVLASFGVLSTLCSLVLIVVAVANVTTAADPVPPLLAFFEGAW